MIAVDWAQEIADRVLAEETARRMEAAQQAAADAEAARLAAENGGR
ncbi:hypothetical protein [Streptomyces nymphaeiformis]|uniref:Uncharacterized protein n=1 Tax=Streptomyces nymphaeiformis TaxID=2663842 RepID=A0A7W7U4S7_9ACTN|nr:hypothetical protein [Streptomyces nymphaeiformis]MBB4984999.1 hypothetical protein [Streptomyces nymphaeiformis]